MEYQIESSTGIPGEAASSFEAIDEHTLRRGGTYAHHHGQRLFPEDRERLAQISPYQTLATRTSAGAGEHASPDGPMSFAAPRSL